MTGEKSEGHLRGVAAKAPRDNRFRRLTGLCGLSVREAASYLDLAEGTVERKLQGKRGTTAEEERELALLYKRIRSGPLDDTDPPGAVRRHIAIGEASMILQGGDPGEVLADWEAGLVEELR